MNSTLRDLAKARGLSLTEYILQRIKKLEVQTGIQRSLFAACPNSMAVIKAALRSSKRCNAPIKFAATLNQVDLDGGYTGLNQSEFVETIKHEAEAINLTSPVIIAIDHGGPWLKDKHRLDKLTYDEALAEVKKSFEAAIVAGYDLIHVDPTIDVTLAPGEIIDIEVVVERTVDLIKHSESFRITKGYPKIAYEVGTEEVHGGLADMATFTQFFELLKSGLAEAGLDDVWPCFVVGKVGTDLHTTMFDPEVARSLTKVATKYGSVIKGHYSDNVSNPEDYPTSGMGAANVGPEFTECEYDGLLELANIELKLLGQHRIAKISNTKDAIWNAVINSNRWQKWVNENENTTDFYANDPARQLWLVKTGARYIWENPEVVAARQKLYLNLNSCGIEAEEILISHIERAMDKYFYKFNLVNLNEQLMEVEMAQS